MNNKSEVAYFYEITNKIYSVAEKIVNYENMERYEECILLQELATTIVEEAMVNISILFGEDTNETNEIQEYLTGLNNKLIEQIKSNTK